MTDTPKKIAVAADHGGYALKGIVVAELRRQGHEIIDLGAHSEERADYPDFANVLAAELAKGGYACGIALCGSGIGISMALNRKPAIRAALCHDVTSARLARQHNDANVLCLGGRLIGSVAALDCIKIFLGTPFEGGRYADRLEKMKGC